MNFIYLLLSLFLLSTTTGRCLHETFIIFFRITRIDPYNSQYIEEG